MSTLQVDISQGIATLTLNRPETLNSITAEDYDALSEALASIDKREDVVITVLQATGTWFCAGTDFNKSLKADPALEINTTRRGFLQRVSSTNTDVSRAFYSHSKILVAALNGPVLGIMAGFLGHFDFIYSMPDAWLACPFTFIGIIAEAGSSVSFANRMGLAKANEVLIFGKKMSAEELLACGFVNEIFPKQSYESFHSTIRRHLLQQLEGLDHDSVLTVKQLIQFGVNEKNSKDATNLRESYAQGARFATGVPGDRFAKLARKEIKHKL